MDRPPKMPRRAWQRRNLRRNRTSASNQSTSGSIEQPARRPRGALERNQQSRPGQEPSDEMDLASAPILIQGLTKNTAKAAMPVRSGRVRQHGPVSGALSERYYFTIRNRALSLIRTPIPTTIPAIAPKTRMITRNIGTRCWRGSEQRSLRLRTIGRTRRR